MSRIVCDVEQAELENEEGLPVDGVVVTCRRCGHEEQSFGTGEPSIRRCLALMGENCPGDTRNYYVSETDER